MDERIRELMEEASTIQAHLDNDEYKRMDIWRRHRDRLFREIADHYNSEMADGGE